ncbi:MAG: DNA primase [Planctomycetes bacterium]|nr:DNA primase [Planctomycetota bacterium]
MTDHDFKRAIEEIKLRAPIEEIVRQRVPELKRRGKLYEACCPFHEEKTPSFKVDPTRGTWRCYGACGDGGDVISFVMTSYGMGFIESAKFLGGQVGVELPRSSGKQRDTNEHDAGLGVLKRAAAFYRERLGDPEAEQAREYLAERGFDQDTMHSFGLGWAPASGKALVQATRTKGVPFGLLEKVGLARQNDRGQYDFFRGRLMFPIRDLSGRTVGFGARRLSDGPDAGPKYINSPESDWFQKGSLVYGLDLAVMEARRAGQLVLMEGYTDIIAAHQQGLTNAAAVLGTSTTDRHAKLLRRSGAKRISLVFDGDSAGKEAAFRALSGLLPEDYELEVAQPPSGQDPCDLLMRDGLEPFQEALAEASPWFEFVSDGVESLEGAALSQAVDRVLGLIIKVKAPVHREDLMRRLAERLSMSLETLKAQLAMTPEARTIALEKARAQSEGMEQKAPLAEVEGDERAAVESKVDSKLRMAWGELAGAMLLDPSLIPMAGERIGECPSSDIHQVLKVLAELHADLDAEIHEGSVLTEMGTDETARALVGRIVQHAERGESPRLLFDGALLFIKRTALELERDDIQERLAADKTPESERSELLQRLMVTQEELRNLNPNAGALAPSH